MSESLPGTAPLEGEAVGSVETSAPPSGEEVVTESAPGTDAQYVEASRFNGLMGRFNRTQNELEQARQRIAELESQAGPPAQEDSMSDDAVQALQAQVASLQSLLVEQQMEAVRAQAIKEFPGAAPFADLIVANSPDEVRDMARLLHERAQANGFQPAAEPPASQEDENEPTGAVTTPPVQDPAPLPPQVAGGTTIGDNQPDPQTRVVDAIKKGDWSEYLRAKFDATKANEGLTL